VETRGDMGKAVLIVDDSRFARLALKAAVAALRPDWFVAEAADGATALTSLAEVRADYVFIDYNMPGEDGLTVAERILSGWSNVRVALVTANVQDAIAARARALGVVFIGKPINPADVAAFLEMGSP